MGLNKAPQLPTAAVGATRLHSVDCTGHLDSGELMTGTPTITEVDTSDLTITNKVVSTAALVIDTKTVAAGKAVQFKVSGMLVANSPYSIKIIAATDAGQTLPMFTDFLVEDEEV